MILAEREAMAVERAARAAAEAAVLQARKDRIVLDLELDRLRFQLAKAQRAMFGQSSEQSAKIGQFELALGNCSGGLISGFFGLRRAGGCESTFM
jgi:hypothetical protein